MKFWGISKINRRVLEIKRILADEERVQEMAREATSRGIVKAEFERQLERENRPLFKELEVLEMEGKFRHDNRTAVISIAAMLISLGIAFGVPIWQAKLSERADIQALYQSVGANGDIFISNFNELKNAQNKGETLSLPETFIEFPLDEAMHKKLQRSLGIDLYRFFLFYANQTNVLNDQIRQLSTEMTSNGSISASGTNNVKAYQLSLNALEGDGWRNAKFNYIYDTSCIEYMLFRTFAFIEVAERDQGVNCSPESLNRIYYHYGYIEAEMPRWIRPELRAALNEREAGLGDRLISN